MEDGETRGRFSVLHSQFSCLARKKVDGPPSSPGQRWRVLVSGGLAVPPEPAPCTGERVARGFLFVAGPSVRRRFFDAVSKNKHLWKVQVSGRNSRSLAVWAGWIPGQSRGLYAERGRTTMSFLLISCGELCRRQVGIGAEHFCAHTFTFATTSMMNYFSRSVVNAMSLSEARDV